MSRRLDLYLQDILEAAARIRPECLKLACRYRDGFPGNNAVFDLEEALEVKHHNPAFELITVGLASAYPPGFAAGNNNAGQLGYPHAATWKRKRQGTQALRGAGLG